MPFAAKAERLQGISTKIQIRIGAAFDVFNEQDMIESNGQAIPLKDAKQISFGHLGITHKQQIINAIDELLDVADARRRIYRGLAMFMGAGMIIDLIAKALVASSLNPDISLISTSPNDISLGSGGTILVILMGVPVGIAVSVVFWPLLRIMRQTSFKGGTVQAACLILTLNGALIAIGSLTNPSNLLLHLANDGGICVVPTFAAVSFS